MTKYLKSKILFEELDRIFEAQKIIILAKMGVDQIFSVIEDIEEIRYMTILLIRFHLGQRKLELSL